MSRLRVGLEGFGVTIKNGLSWFLVGAISTSIKLVSGIYNLGFRGELRFVAGRI